MQKITLTVNGTQQQVTASPEMVLIDYLRKDLHLTGTKQSCDRKGQCGACMVIVNGKAVRSCLTKVVKLEGAEVISVEGLGTPENPHLIQEAFVLAGAIQCGFCTPGMIMAAKALLDKNPDPDVAAIKKALARNLCRCTGYKKIIEAVQLAGRFIRKETTPDAVRSKIGKALLGKSHIRPTGDAQGLRSGPIQRRHPDAAGCAGDWPSSAAPSSTRFIKSIDTSLAEKMPGVVGFLSGQGHQGDEPPPTGPPGPAGPVRRQGPDPGRPDRRGRRRNAGAGPGGCGGGKGGIRPPAGPDDAGGIPGPRGLRDPPACAGQHLLLAADHQGRRRGGLEGGENGL